MRSIRRFGKLPFAVRTVVALLLVMLMASQAAVAAEREVLDRRSAVEPGAAWTLSYDPAGRLVGDAVTSPRGVGAVDFISAGLYSRVALPTLLRWWGADGESTIRIVNADGDYESVRDKTDKTFTGMSMLFGGAGIIKAAMSRTVVAATARGLVTVAVPRLRTAVLGAAAAAYGGVHLMAAAKTPQPKEKCPDPKPAAGDGPAAEPAGDAAGGGGRAANKLRPDTAAESAHSSFKRGPDGKVSNYATYEPNPKNPSGFQEVKRVDVTGRSHRNPDGTIVPTPHIKEAGTKGVRPAKPEELP